MNPSPSPSPLDVVVHTGPADWWVILAGLGPLAVLVAALLAFYINWRTLKQRRTADSEALEQKSEADSRSEWWRRAQWALDRALDDDKETKALGLATLDVLARSDLARKEELELFDIAWKSVSPPDTNGAKTQTAENVTGEGSGSVAHLYANIDLDPRATLVDPPATVTMDSPPDIGDNGITNENDDREDGK